eukprot:jgi/Mesen1/6923/ME000358S06245
MAITAEESQLLQLSWSLIEPEIQKYSLNFFLRIFEIAPAATGLFTFLDNDTTPLATNIRLQKHALTVMTTVGAAVSILADEEALAEFIPKLKDLATRHKGYNVVPAHFAVVKVALLDTLESGCGFDWTPEMAQAWSKSFDILAGVMIKTMTGEE